jgi:hypothetical protein
MTSKIGAGFWMGAAFAAASVLALSILALLGPGDHGTDVALRATARLSLLLFWPAYTGRALTVLFGPAFAGLARHGRDFGLSFAAAHLVHIALILWLYEGLGKSPIPHFVVVYDTVGLGLIYLMTLLSIPRLQAWLKPWQWRFLRDGTMHYVAAIFLIDLVLVPLRLGTQHPMAYLPFSILTIAGPLLRLAAAIRRRMAVSVAAA